MNPLREIIIEEQEKADKELFERIQNNPKPDILDLWALSPERFYEWRKLNDFPILLNHFDKTLLLFQEWKADNNLTNEIIIDTGYLTVFLENKKNSKNKTLYLEKQVLKEKESRVVSYKKLEGKITDLGRDFFFTPILEFTSYLDWLKDRGKNQQILYINSRHHPADIRERVFIHADVYAPSSDFELLKMGGIPIPVTEYGLLFRGKRMEFVNLCGLQLTGEINYGEMGNLSCSYCACDNWLADNLMFAQYLPFDHCSITNFSLANSKLAQWQFYDCNVNGDFVNSQFSMCGVIGGNFRPVLTDCNLFNLHIQTDKAIPDNNLYGYKLLKKIYADQGDENVAKHYYIRENEFIRNKLKGFKYITKTLSYYYWEYGRKPHRIIYVSILMILSFAAVYWFNSHLILNSGATNNLSITDSIYFSTSIFTTLGDGNLSPLGWLRILTTIEAFTGVVNMGFLLAGYTTSKY